MLLSRFLLRELVAAFLYSLLCRSLLRRLVARSLFSRFRELVAASL
jgi:hypothetical protein